MKKKIEELFRLAMKAQEKTSAYVSFETSNHGWGCVVMIMDDGFEVKHGYDGWYEMDQEKFLHGLQEWLNCSRNSSSCLYENKIDCSQIDAPMADEIIQYTLFDEIIFD